MANDTVTLALDGEVQLEDFANAMVEFRKLVTALTSAVGENTKIEWVLQNLNYSSAIVSARGESANLIAVETIARAYLTVGRSLQAQEGIPYPQRVRRPAESIRNLIDGRITSIRFETGEAEAVIRRNPARPKGVELLPLVTNYGAVEGAVQTLSNRRGLRFALYDFLYDKAVSCYLSEDREEIMRDAWGRRAIVEGLVSRDPETGRPISIREVSHVEVLTDVPEGAYLRARGLLPFQSGDEYPETRIRRLRDA